MLERRSFGEVVLFGGLDPRAPDFDGAPRPLASRSRGFASRRRIESFLVCRLRFRQLEQVLPDLISCFHASIPDRFDPWSGQGFYYGQGEKYASKTHVFGICQDLELRHSFQPETYSPR